MYTALDLDLLFDRHQFEQQFARAEAMGLVERMEMGGVWWARLTANGHAYFHLGLGDRRLRQLLKAAHDTAHIAQTGAPPAESERRR